MLNYVIFVVFFIPLCLIYEIRKYIKTKRVHHVEYWFLRIIFYFYVIMLVKVTLFPIPFFPYDIKVLKSVHPHGMDNNIIPFHTIKHILKYSLSLHVKLVQIGGNILLLMPMAFYMLLVKEELRKFVKIFGFVILTSVSIELIQFIIGLITRYNYRNIDIDDVILNTIGGIIGYIIFYIINKLFPKIIKSIN